MMGDTSEDEVIDFISAGWVALRWLAHSAMTMEGTEPLRHGLLRDAE
jgi:hypothetical protein